MRIAIAVLLMLAVSAPPATAKPRAAKRLKSFNSCSALVGYAARHVPRAPVRDDMPVAVVPDQRASAPAEGGAEDTSQTNVQEAGVDEPDIVKTDGRTIFALANGVLHSVGARSPAAQLLGTLELEHGWDATLLLRDRRALVLSSGPRGARMTEIDVSDPAQMRVLRTQDVDGYVVDARLTGRTARVVVASQPRAAYGSRELRRRPSGWLPRSTLADARAGTARTTRAVRCRAVRRPALFSGAGVLTVYTIDLAAGLPAVDADAVFTGADHVYASHAALHVATQRWDDDGTFGANTSIHRFDTSDPDRTGYSGSGAVSGTLLSQFAMSEHGDVLRVATTTGFDNDSESRVTTLTRRNGRLVQRGMVDGLGLGERIYAVRFIGYSGYVVTFRQTDPLYTLDLSDPDQPRVAGELKIPGYSAYLHPVGEELLLGVGQEATGDGQLQGLQLSLFDVSDIAQPRRLQKRQLGERFSQSAVEWDHHAFLWWPATKLAVLPIDSRGFSGAAGFRVSRASGIAPVGRVGHEDTGGAPAGRAVVVGPRLLTISDRGVKAVGLESFAGATWVPFPKPPEPDLPIGEPRPIEPGEPLPRR